MNDDTLVIIAILDAEVYSHIELCLLKADLVMTLKLHDFATCSEHFT